MTRTERKAGALREDGATPVICDALDAEGVRAAVEAAAADVVVNELTDLPSSFSPKAMAEGLERTDRIRREGTRALLDAARAAGARRFVCQSIAFLYAPEGNALMEEDDRAFADAPAPFDSAVRAVLDMEEMVTAAGEPEGVVLRYGFFYGPGTWYAEDGSSGRDVRRRRLPVIGSGQGVWSFIHVEDAAAATMAAVERGPAGIYNVVDDDPAPMREWLPAFAAALGAKRPLRVPAIVARVAAGPVAAYYGTRLRGASNAKAKAQLGWAPGYPSWRQGFAEGLR